MSISLADMKRRKNKSRSVDKLRDKLKNKSKSYNDEREWRCERNKDGNGYAIIRFLPLSKQDIEYLQSIGEYDYDDDEIIPFWFDQYTHGFKGKNGKWYINNCPTTIGENCPVCEANNELVEANGGWDSMSDDHPVKKTVRDRKRKQIFYANVLVIKDEANPENEGKVKIFKYGPAIQEKIVSALIPEFDDEEPIDVSDFWNGANFKLKIRKYKGYANYDKSEFESPSPISDDDEEIEKIWSQEHALHEFVVPDVYKPYDVLKKEFERTLGTKIAPSSIEDAEQQEAHMEEKPSTNDSTESVNDTPDSTDIDDDDVDFFKSLLD